MSMFHNLCNIVTIDRIYYIIYNISYIDFSCSLVLLKNCGVALINSKDDRIHPLASVGNELNHVQQVGQS